MVKRERKAYFIVILANKLPVVFAVCRPGSVIDVVIQGKIVEPRLFITSLVQLFPRDWMLGRVKVDIDESHLVDMRVDLEEAVLVAIKERQRVELGSLGQLAIEIECPS